MEEGQKEKDDGGGGGLIQQLDLVLCHHTRVLWRSWPGRQRRSHPCHSCWQNSPPNH